MIQKPTTTFLTVPRPNYFDLDEIFSCGQTFRFEKQNDGSYLGVACGRILRIKQEFDSLIFWDTSEEEFRTVWQTYFALDQDYASIRARIDTDEAMHLALRFGAGIRILRQDLWEMLITFLISQNNNIPRIKKIIFSLCSLLGTPTEAYGVPLSFFPTPQQLSQATDETLRAAGVGYRADYLRDASRRIAEGSFSLDTLSHLPTCEARELLMDIKGVGGKVADCILLFGMARYEACPHDVWVKRIFEHTYGISGINEKKGYALAYEKWGNYAGIAQQFLFHRERSCAANTSFAKKEIPS
jgi:N-glycosylase/DNA lyase